MIIEVYPISNRSGGVLEALEAMQMDALLFQRPNDPLDYPVLLRTVRRNELLLQAIASEELSECEAGKTRPLSDLSRKGLWTFPSDPFSAIRACSKAAPAVEALPDLESCQPRSSRV